MSKQLANVKNHKGKGRRPLYQSYDADGNLTYVCIMPDGEPLKADLKVLKAVKKIVDYMGHDEYHNYLECLLNGVGKDHIWHAVRTLRDWAALHADERQEAKEIRDAKREARVAR